MRRWFRDKWDNFKNKCVEKFDNTIIDDVIESNINIGAVLFGLVFACLGIFIGLHFFLGLSAIGQWVHLYFTSPFVVMLWLSFFLNRHLIKTRRLLRQGDLYWTERKVSKIAHFFGSATKICLALWCVGLTILILSLTGDKLFIDVTWLVAARELIRDMYLNIHSFIMIVVSCLSMFFINFAYFLNIRERNNAYDRERDSLYDFIVQKEKKIRLEKAKQQNLLPDDLFRI